MPGRSSIFALIRKTREVRIVLMPHCSIAFAIDSFPAVKLRFTGTRPDSVTARLASAPPIDAGSIRPTISSPRAMRANPA